MYSPVIVGIMSSGPRSWQSSGAYANPHWHRGMTHALQHKEGVFKEDLH